MNRIAARCLLLGLFLVLLVFTTRAAQGGGVSDIDSISPKFGRSDARVP